MKRLRKATTALLLLGCAACFPDNSPETELGSGGPAAPEGAPLPRAGIVRTAEELALCQAEEYRRVALGIRAEIEPPEQRVALRSRPAQVGRDELVAMTRRLNFYAWSNQEGCFVNAFVLSGDTVEDRATGLMWTIDDSWHPMQRSEAEAYLAELNRVGVADKTQWRLPSAEELGSLIERVLTGAGKSRIDPRSFVTHRDYWVSDVSPGNLSWMMDTRAADFAEAPDDPDYKFYVRPVCSLRD